MYADAWWQEFDAYISGAGLVLDDHELVNAYHAYQAGMSPAAAISAIKHQREMENQGEQHVLRMAK